MVPEKKKKSNFSWIRYLPSYSYFIFLLEDTRSNISFSFLRAKNLEPGANETEPPCGQSCWGTDVGVGRYREVRGERGASGT